MWFRCRVCKTAWQAHDNTAYERLTLCKEHAYMKGQLPPLKPDYKLVKLFVETLSVPRGKPRRLLLEHMTFTAQQ